MVLLFYLRSFLNYLEELEELLKSTRRIRNKEVRLYACNIAVRQSHINLCNYMRLLVKERSILFITNQIKDVLYNSEKKDNIDLVDETKINDFINYVSQLDNNNFEMTIKCFETFLN